MTKKLAPVLLLIALFSFSSCGNKKVEEKVDSIEKTINKIAQNTSNSEPIYRLYPTRNMWNFLKLDTRNGKISIVQFSVEDDNKQFEYELSNKTQVDNATPGRFILQPTENMYNFIMLDQVSGQTYQVQWNFDEDKRFVTPIR